jgi:hypothetical protein
MSTVNHGSKPEKPFKADTNTFKTPKKCFWINWHFENSVTFKAQHDSVEASPLRRGRKILPNIVENKTFRLPRLL